MTEGAIEAHHKRGLPLLGAVLRHPLRSAGRGLPFCTTGAEKLQVRYATGCCTRAPWRRRLIALSIQAPPRL